MTLATSSVVRHRLRILFITKPFGQEKALEIKKSVARIKIFMYFPLGIRVPNLL